MDWDSVICLRAVASEDFISTLLLCQDELESVICLGAEAKYDFISRTINNHHLLCWRLKHLSPHYSTTHCSPEMR